jgi:hypothetical protein
LRTQGQGGCASPHHLYRTGRLLRERGLFCVQAQLHRLHDLAHDLHLQAVLRAVLGRVDQHALDQAAQDAQRPVAQPGMGPVPPQPLDLAL